MKSIRETLVSLYRKIDPSLSESAANDRVTNFGIITGRANERQRRLLSVATDGHNMALAEKVGRSMNQLIPSPSNKPRSPSQDLGVLMVLIVSIVLKLEEDKQDDFLADYFEATSMMLRLSRLEDPGPIDPGVAMRAAEANEGYDDIMKWFPDAKRDE